MRLSRNIAPSTAPTALEHAACRRLDSGLFAALLSGAILVQCRANSPATSTLDAARDQETRASRGLVEPSAGGGDIPPRSFDLTCVDFDVEHSAVAGDGTLVLAGVRRSAEGDRCALELRPADGGVTIGWEWPIVDQGPCSGGEAPRILGLFVNDAARVVVARANAETPFDTTSSEDHWWRFSLDTGCYLGTGGPRATWDATRGQLAQHGLLVSCEQITATTLQLARWAAIRGGGSANAEVRERIEILDLWGTPRFVLPRHEFLGVVAGDHERAASLVRGSGARPRMLGPGRVELFGDDPKRRIEVVCTPTLSADGGFLFELR